MKSKLLYLCSALFGLFNLVDPCFAQGTAFTYQGSLGDNGSPANGIYDFKFQLYNSPTAGAVIGGPFTNAAVSVSNGLFTVAIDFGSGVFTGSSNWLRIGVRTNGAPNFTFLTVRQQVTPTPYAIYAEGANSAGLSGPIPSSDLSGTYTGPVTFNNAGNSFSGDGAGLTGINASHITTGTLNNNRLSADVALLDANQTFTGANLFANPGGLTINNAPTGISASLFTGLGFQYYPGYGEGALLSSYNDGEAYLSFYTKFGSGYPLAKQAIIEYNGTLALDQQNLNTGLLNHTATNATGLTFGVTSGEGIASKRTAGGNQYGLDFYTDFINRMYLNNAGELTLNNDLYFDNANYGVGFRSSFGGVSISGPLLWGYYGGALGTVGPDEVSLTWDYNGNAWVSNNLSVESLTVRGGFLVVNGLGGALCYIGDDGFGNDVQIGSEKSGVTSLAAYNTADNAYMHFYCSSITIEGGADLAEPFNITPPKPNQTIEPGAVVVIDDNHPGELTLSDRPYDTRVAGVISGANGINPGIQLQQQGALMGGHNVALTGRVYVMADASNGPIRPGDLLTTSTSPGRAMKATDHTRASGAILGKAMTGLSQGQGMVLTLISLQ